jgi:hypothetical protein
MKLLPNHPSWLKDVVGTVLLWVLFRGSGFESMFFVVKVPVPYQLVLGLPDPDYYILEQFFLEKLYSSYRPF